MTTHAPDCSIHDPNAEPAGICDCGALQREVIAALLDSARDALSGWRYIRSRHGDLYGVGWDRVEDALREAIEKAERARKEAGL